MNFKFFLLFSSYSIALTVEITMEVFSERILRCLFCMSTFQDLSQGA